MSAIDQTFRLRRVHIALTLVKHMTGAWLHLWNRPDRPHSIALPRSIRCVTPLAGVPILPLGLYPAVTIVSLSRFA
jgi:hypothetical protein